MKKKKKCFQRPPDTGGKPQILCLLTQPPRKQNSGEQAGEAQGASTAGVLTSERRTLQEELAQDGKSTAEKS